MAHWSQRVPQFTYTPENFSSLFVPTLETTRLSYLLDLLVPNQHHVMFVGNSGTCGRRSQSLAYRGMVSAMVDRFPLHAWLSLHGWASGGKAQ